MSPAEHRKAAEKALEHAHAAMDALADTEAPASQVQAYAAQIHALAAVAQAHAMLAGLPGDDPAASAGRSQFAVAALEVIVRDFASKEPHDGSTCTLCGLDPVTDWHTESCPWRRAVEWVQAQDAST